MFQNIIAFINEFSYKLIQIPSMYNNNIIKHKRPKIKPLQTYLPKEYFQTINPNSYHIKIKNQTVENEHNENTLNPLQKKSIDRSVLFYGNQSINHQHRMYLQKKITSHDFTKKRTKQYTSIRYEQVRDENKKRSPYVKNEFDRRQSLLNKSNKIRSGSINKQLSPSLNRHPKSSLSNPYQVYKHHRKIISLSRNHNKQQNDENTVIILMEEGKKYYKQSKLDKAIESFNKVISIKRNLEAYYLLAISYMNCNQYQKGINVFYQLITEDPSYKKNIYLLVAIAYKKLGKISSATQILTKGINLFPDYYDCIIYRGKLYLKQLMWDKAIIDFNIAIELNPKKGFAYLGKSDALVALNRFDQALNSLTMGLQTDLNNAALLKRAVCYYKMNRFDESLADLQNYILTDTGNSQVYYHRGMIYKKKGNNGQAILNFQQAMKKDNNQDFVTKSLQQILKLKIQEKDFYEALHIITRADNLQINKVYLQDWKAFVQGSLLLMKKKYKEGIDVYTILLNEKQYGVKYSDKNQAIKQKFCFLKPLIHLYRAYGYFSLGILDQAKLDYIQYDTFFQDSGFYQNDLSKKYNCQLLKAIQGFPNNSTIHLNQAIELYPHKSEPYFYKALVITQEYISSQQSELIEKIKQNLDKAILYLPQLSNNHISSIYYHRAVIYLYTNQFDKSVLDIDKAIQKSQDNIPRYFYLRGLIFACCGNFSQAIQDFTVAINLDQQNAKPYLQRAKCLQMQGNPNQAFLDLQKYITLKPEDPLIHKYAGYLLFQNCAYQDCLAAFSHGSQYLADIDLIITKAKCYFLLGKYDQCLETLEVYQKNSGELDYILDSIIINLIKNIEVSNKSQKFQSALDVLNKIIDSRKNEGKLFKLMDIYMIRAGIYACNLKYQEALADFQNALRFKQKAKKEELQKNFLADESEHDSDEQFGWTALEVTYCISVCYIALKEYRKALDTFSRIWIRQEISEDKNWIAYKQLLEALVSCDLQGNIQNKKLLSNVQELKLFQDEKIFSKFLPPLQICLTQQRKIKIYLLFNFPQIEPPQLLPQFDHELLMQFTVKKVQNKPQAPWINRNLNGVVFTSNVQIFENLELSVTDANKKNEVSADGQTIHIQDSARHLSFENEIQIDKKDLKNHFKLDPETQKKLQRILDKKKQK